jgi:hypothetical protein
LLALTVNVAAALVVNLRLSLEVFKYWLVVPLQLIKMGLLPLVEQAAFADSGRKGTARMAVDTSAVPASRQCLKRLLGEADRSCGHKKLGFWPRKETPRAAFLDLGFF